MITPRDTITENQNNEKKAFDLQNQNPLPQDTPSFDKTNSSKIEHMKLDVSIPSHQGGRCLEVIDSS